MIGQIDPADRTVVRGLTWTRGRVAIWLDGRRAFSEKANVARIGFSMASLNSANSDPAKQPAFCNLLVRQNTARLLYPPPSETELSAFYDVPSYVGYLAGAGQSERTGAH
jgi:hypothetical protein